MKKTILILLLTIAVGVLTFIIGNKLGYADGYLAGKDSYRYRPIEELRNELKEREALDMKDFLNGKAGIESKDEGGLFKVKYVDYFSGTLTNSASVAKAKDIKLKVDFYSKTKALIGSKEITVYEYILPGQSVRFKEKLDLPEKVEDFKFSILNASAE
ncbi:hypothetical protein [Nafulsella turpanensis]|uniref:hypothetical protein n=1 Tax=Nafulsella turpanensis TaxID=1265690 RepID=UPI0003722B6F|nr:hypothetical protein [Nafulsella turpanensis]